jgi:hypothetical protein
MMRSVVDDGGDEIGGFEDFEVALGGAVGFRVIFWREKG